MSQVLDLLRNNRSRLVPRHELRRCDWCGMRIPSNKQKRGEHAFCDNRCYGHWMRGKDPRHRRKPLKRPE